MINVGSDLRSILDADPLLRRLFLSAARGQAGAASSIAPFQNAASTGKVQKMINLYASRPAWTPSTLSS
jgi:hypothetical protein